MLAFRHNLPLHHGIFGFVLFYEQLFLDLFYSKFFTVRLFGRQQNLSYFMLVRFCA
jgi:hypothetical protein